MSSPKILSHLIVIFNARTAESGKDKLVKLKNG
jgi:hypothetical protein